MAIQSDFMSAIRQICAERGIEVDDVVEAIKTAMLSAYRKGYETGETLTVEIDPEFGTLQVFADKKVVTKVSDPHTQISLKQAQKIEPKLRVGDHIEIDVTPEGDFGRLYFSKSERQRRKLLSRNSKISLGLLKLQLFREWMVKVLY
jgi:N utilization substance protein A